MSEASSRDTTFTPAVGGAPVVKVWIDQAAPGSIRPHASRHRLLSCLAPAALVLAGTGAAAHAAQLDAELIALCAEFDAMERRIDAAFDNDSSNLAFEAADAMASAIEVDQRRILNRICTLAPVTMAGCQALGRSLALLASDYADDWPSETMDVRLASTLLRGLMGSAAA